MHEVKNLLNFPAGNLEQRSVLLSGESDVKLKGKTVVKWIVENRRNRPVTLFFGYKKFTQAR